MTAVRGLVISGAVLLDCSTYTPPFAGPDGKPLRGSIATLEKVKLGGIDQWLIIRGSDANRPLLLYLHGGPGSPTAPLVRKFCPALEDLFVVVHWEQRGAGKSFSRKVPRESLTVEQLVSDTAELTRLLLERFGRKKLFLLGHSWGSFLGVRTVQKHPDLYYAYVGVGQVVDRTEQERLSYEFVRAEAEERGDRGALEMLDEIRPPPWPQEKLVSNLAKERRLVRKYGGSVYDPVVYDEIVDFRHILFQSEYNLFDKVNWIRGQLVSERLLAPEMLRTNFITEAPKLDLPVFFLQGCHDWQTPAVLVEKYFAALEAPHKELHLFERSAHVVVGEESAKFVRILAERVLPVAASEPGPS